MYRIRTLNKISPAGLDLLPLELYQVGSDLEEPHAVIVRSHNMLQMHLPDTLLAIARAGAGVNNIPVEECSRRGIVVFNTPGANANSVKELVLLGLLLSSRKVLDGVAWVRSLAGSGEEAGGLVEKNKSRFAGPEIKGKTLGVIGLGAVGVMVANDAAALGMKVMGYDPYISVDSAWILSRDIGKAKTLDGLLAGADYISIHTPLSEDTRGMINRDRFRIMKKGVRILNFARGGLVDHGDLKQAIREGIVACYVTDFPDDDLLDIPEVIPIPHLGASTPEAEDNCAAMAARQLREFLERGNVINSVNYPECDMTPTGQSRIVVTNRNVPAMVGQITAVLAEEGINIADMLNRSKGENAYNIIDTDTQVSESAVQKIRNIKGVTMVRVICC